MIINFKGGTKTSDLNIMSSCTDDMYKGSVVKNIILRYSDSVSKGTRVVALPEIFSMDSDDCLSANEYAEERGYYESLYCERISAIDYEVTVHCIAYNNIEEVEDSEEDSEVVSCFYVMVISRDGVLKYLKSGE